MFQQRALQRAAQSGGEQRPGLVRGGIASIVKFVREATSGHLGGPAEADPTSQLTGAVERLNPGPASSLLWGGGTTAGHRAL